MAEIDKAKLEKYRKGELKFVQIFGISGSQLASVLACGHSLFSEGRLEDARKIFEGLAVLDPNNPYIQTLLGAVYQKMQQFDRAIVRYTMALQLYPQDIYALTNRAEVYLLQGKFPEAAEDLKKALDQDKERKSPATQRARLLSTVATESLQKVRKKISAASPPAGA